MASTLPHKILSYLGTHVRKEDRRQCALVCKHWTEPFLDAYWGRIHIGWFGIDIDKIYSNEAFLINAHRVWALKYTDVHSYDYEHLPKLQQFFPRIRYFELDDYASNMSTIPDTFYLSLWKPLTHLHIRLDYTWESVSLQSLFTKLSVLPCLVHFTLYQPRYTFKNPIFSWKDFESLHKHLPQLEYLKHDFVFKPITTDEIENIKTVDPAQTMTKTDFYNNAATLWLFYFALKYPNLQHFRIIDDRYSSDHNPTNYNSQHHQTDFLLLSALDQFFPCLKSAVTIFRHSSLYSLFIFYEILGHFGTESEYELSYNPDLIKDDEIRKCIQPISRSVKTLRIGIYPYSGFPENAAITFDICPKLVTLCIEGYERTIFKVDDILECFPVLRTLSGHNITLSLSSNTHTYTPHPLQILNIKNGYINNDVLNYISLRCNQLKHMSLVDIYYGKADDETGQLIFDMSMTKLDTFILTLQGSLYQIEIFPRHHMVQHMENGNDILQTTQQPSQITWYHVCCDRTNRKPNVFIWELGRRDIEFCQRYLKDFGRRKKRGKWRKGIKKGQYSLVQKRFWKKDLEYGVYVFRFKSVKNYIFRIRT